MTALTRPVTRAMAQQLDRVNSTRPALDDPGDLLRQRDHWKRRCELAAAEIERLREKLAAYEDAHGPLRSSAMLLNNRPVLTPAQAAAQVGISVATVSRYLHSGHWEGTQSPGSNRWHVYADQSLTVKRR